MEYARYKQLHLDFEKLEKKLQSMDNRCVAIEKDIADITSVVSQMLTDLDILRKQNSHYYEKRLRIEEAKSDVGTAE